MSNKNDNKHLRCPKCGSFTIVRVAQFSNLVKCLKCNTMGPIESFKFHGGWSD